VGALVETPIMWTFPRLSARFSAERLLVTGSAIFAARNLLAALAPSGAVLVAIAPLEGAAFGLFFVGGVGLLVARPSGVPFWWRRPDMPKRWMRPWWRSRRSSTIIAKANRHETSGADRRRGGCCRRRPMGWASERGRQLRVEIALRRIEL